MLVALRFHFNIARLLVALANLIFASGQKIKKSSSKACGIEVSLAYQLLQIFNSAQILVALWHCQISFLQ
jgi:hypothetical protein